MEGIDNESFSVGGPYSLPLFSAAAYSARLTCQLSLSVCCRVFKFALAHSCTMEGYRESNMNLFFILGIQRYPSGPTSQRLV